MSQPPQMSTAAPRLPLSVVSEPSPSVTAGTALRRAASARMSRTAVTTRRKSAVGRNHDTCWPKLPVNRRVSPVSPQPPPPPPPTEPVSLPVRRPNPL